MIYTILFLIGIFGLIAQMFLGMSHSTGHAHGSAGHGPSHGHHTLAHHMGAQHGQHFDFRHALSPLLALLSPLTLFSLCLGAGAAGLMVRPLHWPSVFVILAAIAGAILFYAGLVRPIFNFVLQFASKPSQALAGIVSKPTEALTSFSDGRGIVHVTVDGQSVRLLATLENDERATGASVQAGDELTVTSVDGPANTCRVTRL